jgi:NADH-quinone oxidoreductase subunit N
MAVFLLSLMGIPPLVGFMAKLYVFAALIDRAAVSPDGAALYTLAVIGAVNAAVAAFYYARVLKTMIIDEGDEARPLVLALADRAWVYGLAVANLVPVLWWNAVEGGVARHLVLYAGR